MSARIKNIMTAIALVSTLAAPVAAFAQPSVHAHASATSVSSDERGSGGALINDCVHVAFPQCGGSSGY